MSSQARVSDLLLERYLADDLSGEVRERVELALRNDATVAARLQALRAERDAFAEANPAPAFAHRVATQVAVRAQTQAAPRLWWRFLLTPAFGTAAAVLLVAGVVVSLQLAERDASPKSDSAAPFAVAPAEPSAPGGGGLGTARQEDAAPAAAAEGVVALTQDKQDGGARPIADRAKEERSAREPPDLDRKRSRRDESGRGLGGGVGIGGVAEGYGAAAPKDARFAQPPPAAPAPTRQAPKAAVAEAEASEHKPRPEPQPEAKAKKAELRAQVADADDEAPRAAQPSGGAQRDSLAAAEAQAGASAGVAPAAKGAAAPVAMSGRVVMQSRLTILDATGETVSAFAGSRRVERGARLIISAIPPAGGFFMVVAIGGDGVGRVLSPLRPSPRDAAGNGAARLPALVARQSEDVFVVWSEAEFSFSANARAGADPETLRAHLPAGWNGASERLKLIVD